MTIFRFDAEPRVNVIVDGKEIAAIVDTTSPDTLILPRSSVPASRTKAHVQLAGTDLGTIDIRMADVSRAAPGQPHPVEVSGHDRLRKREVGLWRDPRTL